MKHTNLTICLPERSGNHAQRGCHGVEGPLFPAMFTMVIADRRVHLRSYLSARPSNVTHKQKARTRIRA